MPELSYRNATSDDVEDLVALINRAYRGASSRRGWTTEADLLDGQRTDPDSLAAEIARPDTAILLAEEGVFSEDHTAVGCCQMRHEGECLYLGMVTIDPDRQGAGLGKSLIREAERRAVQTWYVTQARMTVISLRAELIAFYERLGYRPTGARAPFPYGDERFGLPRRDDLEFVELAKAL